MFMKIVYKSEANYLCFYQKRSYTEPIGRFFSLSVSVLYFSVSDITMGGFKINKRQNKVRSLTTLSCNKQSGNQLRNQKTGHQKAATLKPVFF